MKATPLTTLEIERYYSSRVEGLIDQGGNWRAPCPIHQGDRDSLSINKENGYARCHSACNKSWDAYAFEQELMSLPDFKAALKAVNEVVGRETVEPHKNGHAKKPKDSGQFNVVATYDYRDEEGRLLFQACRLEPKSFCQRRPNPDKPGGWEWSIKGVRNVLYRTERLAKLPEGTQVLIVEGEKDVHTAERLGFIATTNAMGAGKWRAEHTQQVSRFRLVLAPDQDTKGQEHGQAIHNAVLPHCQELRMLRLPKGKDLTEWVEQGGTKEDLARLIAQSPPIDAKPVYGDPEWADGLLRQGGGGLIKDFRNSVHLLRYHPDTAGVFSYDNLAKRIMVSRQPVWDLPKSPAEPGLPWSGLRPFTDEDEDEVACFLANNNLSVSRETSYAAVRAVARKRKYHAIEKYLSDLQWDGIPRLDVWLSHYMGVRRTAYTMAVGARWMISAVARIFRPGCQADYMLILEGAQGLGKSRVWRELGGIWYMETHVKFDNEKEAALNLASAWICDLGELRSLKRSDADSLKAFLTRTSDHFRPPYGRTAETFLRQCVFCGSTNDDQYLADPTGNRRFWPVRCGAPEELRYDQLGEDRDQLWAEAVVRYRAGDKWYLWEPELQTAAVQEQKGRRETDSWFRDIERWTEHEDQVMSEDILDKLNIPKKDQTPVQAKRVAGHLRELGFERKQLRILGKPTWCFVRTRSET